MSKLVLDDTATWRALMCMVCLIATGCASGKTAAPSQQVLDVIALCNAGYSVSIGIEAQADLVALAKGNARGEAKLSKSIRGQFLSNAGVTEDRAVELYDSYVRCVQSERSLAELIVILQQRREVLVRQLIDDGRAEELVQFEHLYASYLQQTQANQKVAAHETGREIQRLLVAAAEEAAKTNGAVPNYFFSHEGSSPKDLAKLKAAEQAPDQSARCTPGKVSTITDGEFIYRIAKPCPNPINDAIKKFEDAVDECVRATGSSQDQCRERLNSTRDQF